MARKNVLATFDPFRPAHDALFWTSQEMAGNTYQPFGTGIDRDGLIWSHRGLWFCLTYYHSWNYLNNAPDPDFEESWVLQVNTSGFDARDRQYPLPGSETAFWGETDELPVEMIAAVREAFATYKKLVKASEARLADFAQMTHDVRAAAARADMVRRLRDG